MKRIFFSIILFFVLCVQVWAIPPIPPFSSYTGVVSLFGSGTCSGYLKSDGTCDSPSGAGTVTSSGTPTIHQWPNWTTATNLKGITVTSSSPVCTGATGEPVACAGTEGVWQVAGSYQATLTNPVTGVASPSAGFLTKWGASGNSIVDGLKFGTMTDTDLCTYSTANGLQCTLSATTYLAAGGKANTAGTADIATNLAANGAIGGSYQLTDGSTIAVNWNNGASQYVTLTSTGRTVTFANPVAGNVYRLTLIQDGSGSETITTWLTIKWYGGAAPTLSTAAGRYDSVTCHYINSVYLCSAAVGFY